MERAAPFLPSILIIAAIATATLLYLRWIIKRFGDNLKSVEWYGQNFWKFVWLVDAPYTNVLAPTLEELIFRAPLIVAFGSVSPLAWYAVLGSGALFALTHWFGKKILLPEVLYNQGAGAAKSDNVVEEVERLQQENRETILARRVVHVALTLLLSILAGYFGIKHQSLWVSVGIHFLWNLVMPALLPLLNLLCLVGLLLLSSFWVGLMRRRRG